MRWLMLILVSISWPLAANATSITTTATSFTGDPLEVTLTFDDAAAGSGEVRVDVSVVGGSLGDLRGVFLNLTDAGLLAGLTVTGPDVTAFDTSGSVIDLGFGNNLQGGGSPCPCDLAIEIGSPGMGQDDIASTWFILSHSSESLDLSILRDQLVGVRVTSTGEFREGSSKLGGVVVPEPMISALLLAAAGLGLVARVRR